MILDDELVTEERRILRGRFAHKTRLDGHLSFDFRCRADERGVCARRDFGSCWSLKRFSRWLDCEEVSGASANKPTASYACFAYFCVYVTKAKHSGHARRQTRHAYVVVGVVVSDIGA